MTNAKTPSTRTRDPKRASRTGKSPRASTGTRAPCPACGHDAVRSARARVSIRFITPAGRSGVASAVVTTLTCERCGCASESPESAAIRDDAIRRELGLLTPGELRAARERLGWSRRELAEKTGLGSASLFRWEMGRTFQNRSSDLLLRAVLGIPLPGGRGAVGAGSAGRLRVASAPATGRGRAGRSKR